MSPRPLRGKLERQPPAGVNEQRLIGCVQRFPLLYDANHPEYLALGKKADVWNEIADILGFSANTCKSRWNSMRDGYRKSIRKNKMRARNGENPVTYKHAKRLEFLRPYLRAYGDIEEDDDAPKPAYKVKEERFEISCFSGSREDLSESRAPDVSEACYSESVHESVSVSMRLPRPEHPVDAFLGCIGAMIKAMPPYYQAMAKAEMFAAAHKYELLSITGAQQGDPSGGGAPLDTATSSDEMPSSLSVKTDPLHDVP